MSTSQRSPAFRVKANVANRIADLCSPSRSARASACCGVRNRLGIHGFPSLEDSAIGVGRFEGTQCRDESLSFERTFSKSRVRNDSTRQTTAKTKAHLKVRFLTYRFRCRGVVGVNSIPQRGALYGLALATRECKGPIHLRSLRHNPSRVCPHVRKLKIVR